MNRLTIASAIAATAAMATPGMAAGPTGHATPSLQLTNGQAVKVTGKGFTPNEQVFIVECNKSVANGGGVSACDTVDGLKSVTTTRKGLVPATTFTVFTGAVGNGTCGTAKTDRTCYIAISTSDESQYALAKIVFTTP